MRGILFVDNEITMKLALGIIFRSREGFRMFFAQTENEVFSYLANNEIAVMVCDYNLGTQTGPELIKKTKEMFPNLKTIIMSGEDPEAIRAACDAVDVNLILPKVELHRSLIPAINKILED